MTAIPVIIDPPAPPRAVNWKAVGKQVRAARRNGLRPTAEAAGIGFHALWGLERGNKPKAENFLRICILLELDPFELTGLRPTGRASP